ncbi:molybdopterin-dependent oxidoreductase [Haladaptatus sp. NG-SE-30]
MDSPDCHTRETPPLSAPITVSGDRRVSLSGEALSAFPIESRTVTVRCASGMRHTATWSGIPVLDLLSAADIPGEITHFLVESDDGYRICVDITAALDSLLAFFQDGTLIVEQQPYETRFIAPDINGARTAKDVTLLEVRQLAAGIDPETVEDMFREDE